MANGIPQPPDPTKILSAGVDSVSDLLNTGVRSINTLGSGLQGNLSKAASALNLPAAPTAVPPLPELPPISQGLPNLPPMPAGLPPLPGIPGAGSGGGGEGGAPAGEKKAAGAMGYGERNGSACIRTAGASSLGYGEI